MDRRAAASIPLSRARSLEQGTRRPPDRVFDEHVANDAAAHSRLARPEAARSAGVVDPARGTSAVVGLLVTAIVVLSAALVWAGVGLDASPLAVAALAVAAELGERIAIPLGPRSWYTPSTPVIVLAGLLGGPAAGALVASAGQLGPPDGAWRRRLAQAAIGSMQGVAAGVVGVVAREGGVTATDAAAAALAALALAVAVNASGRAVILRARRITPLRTVWTRGTLVDLVDAAIATPIVAVLIIAAGASEVLVVAAATALLAALTVAQGVHRAITDALAAEQRNARRDVLTGAPNRLAFEEMLGRQHARTVRGDHPAGVFLVDVDRFKSVNDRFGHDAGDEVLAEVVQRLQAGLRGSDVVARWGGEEITILAPGMRGPRALEQYGERIRRLVSDLPVTTSREAIPVTVSVGGTLLDGSVSPAEAIRRADGAMYEAKRTRDATVVSLPPRLSLRLESA